MSKDSSWMVQVSRVDSTFLTLGHCFPPELPKKETQSKVMARMFRESSKHRRMRQFFGLIAPVSLLWLFVAGPVGAQWNPMNPVLSVQQEADGVQLTLQNGALKLQVCSDFIIRVHYSPTAVFPSRQEFLVIKDSWPATKWETQTSVDAITLSTSRSRFNNRFLNALYLSSEVADVLDYYFLYGPEFDKIIGGYRELTGAPPMFGKWAYGFWQCKNKYNTQEELLGVAHKYRQLHIPADNIVQDWFWWYTMGEPVFDKSRYPDPPGMLEDLHKNNFHLMISFWPYFRPGTKTYEEMDKRGFFIDKTKVVSFHPAQMGVYDAFNPEARKYYWNLMDQALFKIGVDAWWLDTTEPETEDRETNILVTNKTFLGNGARYANMFPLMTTSAVYQGQRSASEKKRVFILSRSAFAGAQRNAAAVWSGDVNSDWVFFKKQIPAGLNYSISGLPYWTTDIGGFVSGNPDDPQYRELFIRWFQFGVFNPLLRVHGTRSTNQNELWSYGADAQKILVSYDSLRYRLLPYIYSLAWMTTSQGYTPMRGLVMDFRSDARTATINDQFMFGPAFLVNPVTEPGANSRRVYLPKAKWFDFWTGTSADGPRTVDAAAPIEKLPLFVRAGSILLMGPEKEWSTEKAEDPMELRIYRGADGDFTLYEDENDGYNYEKGVHATIPFHWDETKQALTIGERKGDFPGMLAVRSFQIVFVGQNHGVGILSENNPDHMAQYGGN